MRRDVDLKEITDGKFYGLGDMVRADCRSCVGCSKCCRDTVDTIILDPLDCFRLTRALAVTFDELIQREFAELNLVDGIILPNLKRQEASGGCPFLNTEGRCSIHAARPGFCRIFPLGRYYSGRTFCYILQTKECPEKRSKIRVSKWIDTPFLPQNQKFVNDWHYFLEDLSAALTHAPEETVRQAQLYLLHAFYRTAYGTADEETFYGEFFTRLEKARMLVS